MRMSRFIAMASGLAALLAAPCAFAASHHATVSYLEGDATDSAGGTESPQALAVDSTVSEGDVIQTGDGAKLELRMADGSVVRLGPSSKMQLTSAYFGPHGRKRFSAKLFFGRIWSKVAGLVGGDSKFEVQTDNAVAGVRGTTFRVDARHDHSVLVRVYAGAVAMAPTGGMPIPRTRHHHGGRRVQVAGPSQVTKRQWEEIVGKMMQMYVSADGTPGKPQAFTLNEDAKDAWALWNIARDKK